jgi:hypothetical protein
MTMHPGTGAAAMPRRRGAGTAAMPRRLRARTIAAARHRWVALVAAAAAAALVPWTLGLARMLPETYLVAHWDATWIGFDAGLVASLGVVAYGAWRRRPLFRPAALISSTLLICDAWFDVSTAAAGTDVVASLAAAILVEVPLAAVLAWGGYRTA